MRFLPFDAEISQEPRGFATIFSVFYRGDRRYPSSAKRTRKNPRTRSNHRFRRPSDTYIRPPRSLFVGRFNLNKPFGAVYGIFQRKTGVVFGYFFRRRLCPPPPLYMRATPRERAYSRILRASELLRPNRRQCLRQVLFCKRGQTKPECQKQAQRKIRQAFSAFLQPPAKSSYAALTRTPEHPHNSFSNCETRKTQRLCSFSFPFT